MVRFKIENIVHPSIRPHAVDNFKCPICLCVLYEPVQTAECHHLFCANCLMSSDLAAFPAEGPGWSAAGPGWKPLQEVNKVVLRQLHALKVYCPHHREAAKEARDDGGGEGGDAPNGAKRRKVAAKKAARGSAGGRLSEEPEEHCSWEGDYGALLSKHLGECPLHTVDCPRGCGAKVRRRDLGAHDEICPESFRGCGICGERIRPEEAQQHRREKAELHAQILERKLAEETTQRKAAERRLEESTADRQLEQLERTLATFRTAVEKRLEESTAEQRSDRRVALEAEKQLATFRKDTSKRMGLLEGQIESLLRAKPTNKGTWTFKVKDVLEQAPLGGSVASTPFELLGCGPLSFSLFPRGGGTERAAMRDKVHLFLHGPFSVAGEFSVKHGAQIVGSWTWTNPSVDVSKGAMCSKGRLPTQAGFATYEEVTISFEATEVIAVAKTSAS